jgi:hypothetical protein
VQREASASAALIVVPMLMTAAVLSAACILLWSCAGLAIVRSRSAATLTGWLRRLHTRVSAGRHGTVAAVWHTLRQVAAATPSAALKAVTHANAARLEAIAPEANVAPLAEHSTLRKAAR